MKNIHVLPTDKPSKLFYNVGGALLFTKWDNYNGVNIYITSDEEIKEGDWIFDFYLRKNTILKSKKNYIKNDIWYYKKIILTTDQDLIKNGVQAIDDEFLEWFVKNPSCEKVEIERNYADEGVKGITYYGKYFLIIPQEEPKNICIQTGLPCGMQCLSEEACNSIRLKQETLEEVIGREFQFYSSTEIKDEKYVYLIDKRGFKIAVNNIIKWQAERMYSEEEVKKLIELHSDFIDSKIDYEGINNATTAISNPEWNDEEWFEQFKNK